MQAAGAMAVNCSGWSLTRTPGHTDVREKHVETGHASTDECADAIRAPKVALLFQTESNMPHAMLWQQWLASVAGDFQQASKVACCQLYHLRKYRIRNQFWGAMMLDQAGLDFHMYQLASLGACCEADDNHADIDMLQPKVCPTCHDNVMNVSLDAHTLDGKPSCCKSHQQSFSC